MEIGRRHPPREGAAEAKAVANGFLFIMSLIKQISVKVSMWRNMKFEIFLVSGYFRVGTTQS